MTIQQLRDEHSRALSLGEWAVSDDPADTLSCLGLGSCVALCLSDVRRSIAGMAHMVLPDSSAAPRPSTGAKFVDIAIPLVLKEMKARGAIIGGVHVYLVGGAEMLSAGGGVLGNVGDRNAEASLTALKAAGLHANDTDLGGNHGRTVRLQVATGELTVSSAGREPRLLSAALRAAA